MSERMNLPFENIHEHPSRRFEQGHTALSKLLDEANSLISNSVDTTAPDNTNLYKLLEDQISRAALTRVHRQELQVKIDNLCERKKRATERLRSKVGTALASLAASFTFMSGTSSAHDSGVIGRDRVSDTTFELRVMPDLRHSNPADLFNFTSPLAFQNNRLRLGVEQMAVQELDVLKRLNRMVWQDHQEWAGILASNEDGIIFGDLVQGGAGGLEFHLPSSFSLLKNRTQIHTHPITEHVTSGVRTVSREDILAGHKKPPIQPPSVPDLLTCMDNQLPIDTHRVVDARGVWQYECDPQNTNAQKLFAAKVEFQDDLKRQIEVYGLRSDDAARVHALFSRVTYFGELGSQFEQVILDLDGHYPGFWTGVQETIEKFSFRQKFLVQYLDEKFMAMQYTDVWTDEEFSRWIAGIALKLKTYGISVNYIPFRDEIIRESRSLNTTEQR